MLVDWKEWGGRALEAIDYIQPSQNSIKLGLTCMLLLCLLGISHGEKGYAALPGRESDFQASLGTAIKYAVAVNCPRIHVLAGLLNESISADKAEETFISNIRQAADKCSKVVGYFHRNYTIYSAT